MEPLILYEKTLGAAATPYIRNGAAATLYKYMAGAAPTTFKTWGCYYHRQLAWSRCYFEYNTHGASDT